ASSCQRSPENDRRHPRLAGAISTEGMRHRPYRGSRLRSCRRWDRQKAPAPRLFHLVLDEIDEVLALFDGLIYGKTSNVTLDMVDASSLLWRLHLQGVDVGDRFQAIADNWTP